MDAAQLLSQGVRDCHAWFNATMSDVSSEQAHWLPPNRANPISAVFAHVVVGADFSLHTLLNGRAPLFAAGDAVAPGLNAMPPPGDWGSWAQEVRMDLDAFRGYADKVYAAWAAYLERLSGADLERNVDLSIWGMGQRTLGQFLIVQMEHFSGHTGEVSCLKGLQGAVGYRAGTPDGIG